MRPGREDDLEAASDVYDHYVRNSVSTFDLTSPPVEDRRAWFKLHSGGPYRVWVAEEGPGAVVGYAASSPFRPRLGYRSTVEVSIYLHPRAVGQGLGTRLYRSLFDSIRDEELHRAVAMIAQPNPASVALHTRWGFREVGRLHEVGRKFDRYWDVAFFERALAPGVPVQPDANP